MLDLTTTGDGMLSALRVLSLIKRSGCKLSELASVMHKLPQVLINLRVDKKIPIEELKESSKKLPRYQPNMVILVVYWCGIPVPSPNAV